ncbi:hypothetical protein SVAN01_04909 [Stagonosporopsis vannaccii]|nr:hypothetical protein SVAN01_04909 [Stagonosporopsis vannaccii]
MLSRVPSLSLSRNPNNLISPTSATSPQEVSARTRSPSLEQSRGRSARRFQTSSLGPSRRRSSSPPGPKRPRTAEAPEIATGSSSSPSTNPDSAGSSSLPRTVSQPARRATPIAPAGAHERPLASPTPFSYDIAGALNYSSQQPLLALSAHDGLGGPAQQIQLVFLELVHNGRTCALAPFPESCPLLKNGNCKAIQQPWHFEAGRGPYEPVQILPIDEEFARPRPPPLRRSMIFSPALPAAAAYDDVNRPIEPLASRHKQVEEQQRSSAHRKLPSLHAPLSLLRPSQNDQGISSNHIRPVTTRCFSASTRPQLS